MFNYMKHKKVLAIFAHPDDVEQFCGGTLILLRQAGYQILVTALTSGECGTTTLNSLEIAKIRDKEAKRGTKIIGADYQCLKVTDGIVGYYPGRLAHSLTGQPYLYHSDPQGLISEDGQIVRVNTIVDISSVIEKKIIAFSSMI